MLRRAFSYMGMLNWCLDGNIGSCRSQRLCIKYCPWLITEFSINDFHTKPHFVTVPFIVLYMTNLDPSIVSDINMKCSYGY